LLTLGGRVRILCTQFGGEGGQGTVVVGEKKKKKREKRNVKERTPV